MKLGIVGSGSIINTCLEALQAVAQVNTTSLCVRKNSRKKGEEIAEKFAITTIFTDYDHFLQTADIDAVYIGIVNDRHYEYAKKALLANKAVICEKPLTATLSETLELAELAKRQSCFFFEAITLLYLPNYQFIKQKLPEIGNIKLVQTNYSQYSSRYDQYLQGNILPAFSPEHVGGALSDLNIYNLHFIIGLFGKPESAQYHANKGFNGIDTSGICVLQYPSFIATCSAAKDSNSPNFAIIQGEKGYIQVEGAVNACPKVSIVLNNSDSSNNAKPKQETTNRNMYKNRMVEEFKAFAAMYHQQNLTLCYHYLDHSIKVMATLEEAKTTP